MPGIDLSEKGVEQAEAAGRAARRSCRSRPSTRARSSARRRPRSTIAAHHGLEVQPLPGVIEADYGDWTGGKIADLAKTDEWKVVQVAPSRGALPERRVDRRDAVADGRRARRGRRRAPGRDDRGRESRRPDQVGDRALHRHAPRPVPARARVARVGHGVRASTVRRDDGEVQRHRRPRRAAPAAAEAGAARAAEAEPRRRP